MRNYFVVDVSEDGDCDVTAMTKEELLEYVAEVTAEGRSVNFRDRLPDGNRWDMLNSGKGPLIIKGEIVVPKPKQVVESFDVD